MVVLPKTSLQAIFERQAKLRELIDSLRRDRELNQELLTVALHELALAQGSRDRQAFARRWVATKRRAWASEGSLPLTSPNQTGGDRLENGTR